MPGHRPAKIEELVGDITFIARTDGHTCHVAGTGMRTGTGVRFHQKDVATGKDLRMWQITVTGDHHFATQAVVP